MSAQKNPRFPKWYYPMGTSQFKKCIDPVYSIIIPAYNEGKELPFTLNMLHAAMQTTTTPGEVIVVDNNSTDATNEVARSRGVKVVFEAVNQISRARNTGARTARGRFFFFLDADTRISPLLLNLALQILGGNKFCGGGVRVNFNTELPHMAAIAFRFWDKISVAFDLAPGCFIFCLRDAFEDVGGFSQTVYAGEELILSCRLQRWGRKRQMPFKVLRRPAIVTSARKLSGNTPHKTALLFLATILFPPALFFRSLCAFWYHRRSLPADEKEMRRDHA